MVKRLLTFATDKIYNLPILVLMPHSRCNCRCIMCDIWKANSTKRELTVEDLEKHIAHFKKLNVREVILSGGEALMHANLWKLCELLKNNNIRITLLSTGLLVEKHAGAIVEYISEVIISIDGSQEVHDKIRNIPNGFEKIAAGIKALRALNPSYRVTARCVIQHHNYHDFINIVEATKKLALNQVSFLAADVSTPAFNREAGWDDQHLAQVALTADEANAFDKILDKSFVLLAQEYETRFIAESMEKIKKIAQYYKAINNAGNFPTPRCNAPWVSAVIETDGSVMPCFFHKPYGNIFENNFESIINSKEAIRFRKSLDVETDATCKRCVCSLKLGLTKLN